MHEEVRRCHRALPGIVRATLIDSGVSEAVIARHKIGWCDERVAVPVRGQDGRVAILESWRDPREAGGRVGAALPQRSVELFGWGTFALRPERVLVVEGVHECLVLESYGIAAVSATGSGRFFKAREWAEALRQVPGVVVALKRGERRERKPFLPSRHEVVERVLEAVPHAQVFEWPSEVGRDGGAFEFFVTCGRGAGELEAVLPAPPRG